MRTETKKLARHGLMDAYLMAVGVKYRLTPTSAGVFMHIVDNAFGNGFDFAVSEDALPAAIRKWGPKAVEQAVYDMHGKGLIELHEPVMVSGSPVQQITIEANARELAASMYQRAARLP